jgi:RNA polymerase sigma-70 factor, ECF subfamily
MAGLRRGKITETRDTQLVMTAIAELSPRSTVAVAASPDEARQASERVTILAARQGERASMQAIYEAQAPSLLRRLRHLTGDLGHAQDLTHDVFVVAFCGRAPFDGTASLSTWLYGIAANKWRNDQRKTRRRLALLSARAAPEKRGSEASEGVDVDELQRQFDAALAELSVPLREAFVLRVLEALPLHEAAQLAGVSQPTMSKRARKAEARVRAALESNSQPEEP